MVVVPPRFLSPGEYDYYVQISSPNLCTSNIFECVDVMRKEQAPTELKAMHHDVAISCCIAFNSVIADSCYKGRVIRRRDCMFIFRMCVHFSSSILLIIMPKMNTTVLYCVGPLTHLNAPWGLEGLIV